MAMTGLRDSNTAPQADEEDFQSKQGVVVLFDGTRVAGKITFQGATTQSILVKLPPGSEETIPFNKIRYILLEKSKPPVEIVENSAREPQQGSRPRELYRIEYRDGYIIKGAIQGSMNARCGVHLFQIQRGVLWELFIPHSVIKDFRVAQIGERRRSGAQPAEAPRAAGAPHPSTLHARTVSTPDELKAISAQRADFTSHPLGQILVDAGLISKKDLVEGLERLRKAPGKRLGDLLVESGRLTTTELHEALAQQFDLPFVDLRTFEVDPSVLTAIPAALARKYNFMPLMFHDDHLYIAVENPHDVEAINALRFVIGRNVEVTVSTQEDISWAITTYYGAQEDEEALEELESREPSDSTEKKEILDAERLSKEKPVVRMVEYIVTEAIRRGASDIHIRPGQGKVSLVYRIDGSLVKVRSFRKQLLPAVVSRIKIMGRMDISERRLPQDGQARVVYKGKAVDLRISAIPTVEGESVVIRILDTDVGIRSVSQLGLTDSDTRVLEDLLHKSYGLFLVTGPTGSGKSTTLYAALNELIKQNINIITVEDPVEYHIDAIEQIQVKPDVGYTFAEALRHILRHDPDAIMIGEIRDQETAKIAVESALTGHVVLSTLHTNSAAATIVRLLEMGLESYLISSTLLGVLAQRLIRRNCPHCLDVEEVDSAIRQSLRVSADEVFYRGKGCEHCNGTGYKGRMVAYELLLVDEAVRESIEPGVSAAAIQKPALAAGMVPLTANALASARAKLTSLAEVYRVQLG